MIAVEISRNEAGNILGFTSKGHAGYAEQGQDIICAAVSAICYTAVGYFDTTTDASAFHYEIDEDEGFMKFEFASDFEGATSESNQAVLEAMVIGLRQVQEAYGQKFVKVRDNRR